VDLWTLKILLLATVVHVLPSSSSQIRGTD